MLSVNTQVCRWCSRQCWWKWGNESSGKLRSIPGRKIVLISSHSLNAIPYVIPSSGLAWKTQKKAFYSLNWPNWWKDLGLVVRWVQVTRFPSLYMSVPVIPTLHCEQTEVVWGCVGGFLRGRRKEDCDKKGKLFLVWQTCRRSVFLTAQVSQMLLFSSDNFI